MKINIIGNILGQSGYDIHTRSLANAINKLEDIEVCLTCQLPQNWNMQVSDDELKMIQSSKEDAEVNLLIGTPPAWEYYLCEDKKFIGFLVFEGNKIPKSWLDIMDDDRVSQIWCPSIHTHEAILNTLNVKIDAIEHYGKSFRFHPTIGKKVRVVPHGINPDTYKPIETVTDDIFRYTMCGGWPSSWKDRKGLSYAIKSFMEEFTIEDKVEMLVKINSCYGIDLNKNLEDLKIQNQKPPKVTFVLDDLKQSQLNEFYNKGDVFVTTSLAEAFNLPPLESMACGVPVLSTDFGGMTDFVNEKNGWLLTEGEMEEVKWDIMYEGISWKKPSIEEIRKKMREIYNDWKDNKRKVIKSKSEKALENSKKWTWENSAKIALKNLEQYLLELETTQK